MDGNSTGAIATVIRGTFKGGKGLRTRLKGPVKGAVPDWVALSYLYRRAHGRLPNLVNPTSFTEKVLWRTAFDRRPLLAQISDKAGARDYVIARVGRHAVPELYFSTTRPDTIPFEELPNKFVVKPTHASGWLALVEDATSLDRAALVSQCEQWLGRNYYLLSHEWVYKYATPRIHVEEFVQDGPSGAPFDYKFFVFDGEVHMIQVDAHRFVKHRRALYSRSWERIDVRMACDQIPGPVPRPDHLEGMIEAAERLGAEFDFLRVDCLESPKGFCINELTATPCRGLSPFDPISYDRYLGSLWKMNGQGSDARSRAPRAAASAVRVSIVICNYNYARFLDGAIRSALSQDHPDVEVIVVDDGSTDDSRAVMEKWGSAVRAIYQPNGGQIAAYNAGFEHVTGDIVLFLDSDDALDRKACRSVVGAFGDGEVVKVHFPLRLVDEKGLPLGTTIPSRLSEGDLAERLRANGELYDSPPGSGNAYRVSALKRLMPIVPDAQDRHGADFFAIFGVSLLGKVAVAGKEALGSYRVHQQQDATELVFGNASRRQYEPHRTYARHARLKEWVRERLGPEQVLAPIAAPFSLEKQGYAIAIFRAESYLSGLRAGAPLLARSVLPSIGRMHDSWVRRAALAGWAASVLVLPRKAGLPLARFVCNPASR